MDRGRGRKRGGEALVKNKKRLDDDAYVPEKFSRRVQSLRMRVALYDACGVADRTFRAHTHTRRMQKWILKDRPRTKLVPNLLCLVDVSSTARNYAHCFPRLDPPPAWVPNARAWFNFSSHEQFNARFTIAHMTA